MSFSDSKNSAAYSAIFPMKMTDPLMEPNGPQNKAVGFVGCCLYQSCDKSSIALWLPFIINSTTQMCTEPSY